MPRALLANGTNSTLLKGKERERERETTYKVWNYIKHSRAIKEPTRPLFERDEIAKRYLFSTNRREREIKIRDFLIPVRKHNICRKNGLL